MIIKIKKIIESYDFDDKIKEVYDRPYSFQQQDGCKDRGMVEFTVPDTADDYENDTIPEEVNGDEMGVSFKAWLERDPEKELDTADDWARHNGLGLFWNRNFYPDTQMILNDLHSKGLLEEGTYYINVDW